MSIKPCIRASYCPEDVWVRKSKKVILIEHYNTMTSNTEQQIHTSGARATANVSISTLCYQTSQPPPIAEAKAIRNITKKSRLMIIGRKGEITSCL